MPTLTRLYVKTSLVYLMAALLLALVFALAQATTLPPLLAATGPVYFHLFLVGWVTQLSMGIVFWMFPKHSREHPAAASGWRWQPTRCSTPGCCCGSWVIRRTPSIRRRNGAGCWLRRPSCSGWPALASSPTPGAGSRSAEMPRLSVWFIRMALL